MSSRSGRCSNYVQNGSSPHGFCPANFLAIGESEKSGNLLRHALVIRYPVLLYGAFYTTSSSVICKPCVKRFKSPPNLGFCFYFLFISLSHVTMIGLGSEEAEQEERKGKMVGEKSESEIGSEREGRYLTKPLIFPKPCPPYWPS